MIDLHQDDVTLGRHVQQHYGHLSPAPNPDMRRRMQDWDQPLADEAQDEAAALRWLETPAYGIAEAEARNRARGALLGLAVGDAVGTTIEFTPRDSARVEDMVGGGPFNLQPGEWTDDTSMALCLADALIADRDFNPETFARLLSRWYREGYNSMNGRCFDIGMATRTAIEGREALGMRWRGNTDPATAGNGSIIRLAPLAIAYRSSLEAIWRLAQPASVVTHGALEAIHGARLLGIILCHLLQGAGRDEAFAPKIAPLPPRLQIINAGEYKSKTRDQIRSSGYVVDTLEAALWAVWNTDNFRDAVLLAANLGDDADSVAAVAGQLAGALYGESGMPQAWRARLAWSDDIRNRADTLFDLQLSGE
ncbi:ADP-ribosylarginine hydrolase Tri1 [Novosphingobium terrae]|uniref:ADP-ribosylarginine hydrolase Tri1 n=1 Tax=Novosphingobium terrae TaxID=2726189 RepID=UPI001981EF82|nr:ADP-ribosylarginine hydrolase Tri1 [Novosphingobium terrae]